MPGSTPPPPGDPAVTPSPPSPEIPVAECKDDKLCGIEIKGDVFYGTCKLGSSPSAACAGSGATYAGSASIGCSDSGCYCCIKDTASPPSSPVPPVAPVPPVSPAPPSSLGGTCNLSGACGVRMPKGSDPILGKCFKGKDPRSVCRSNGLEYNSLAIGCSDDGACFCCVDQSESSPVAPPPPVSVPSPPPPSSPPPSSPPPPFPPPAISSCPATCSVVVSSNGGNSETITGNCVEYSDTGVHDIQDATDTCYNSVAVPVPGNRCGPTECNSVCCIDASALCGGTQAANCPQGRKGACQCLLTNAGVGNPCLADGGLVHDPDLGQSPSGGGNGCAESNCNAYAAQYLKDYPQISASCCSYCPARRRSLRGNEYGYWADA